MRKSNIRTVQWMAPLALAITLGMSSCKTSQVYQITNIEGDKIEVTSAYDINPSAEASAILAPYKLGVDSVMGEIIGYSAHTLDKYRPESPLSNLVADVLRNAAKDVIGQPADIGLMNIGGVRNILPEGNITVGTVFEILPFENSLCVLSIQGKYVKELMNNIALVKGEGISNVNLVVENGKVVSALVGGEPIDENRMYSLATIDYIADGNDGMKALVKAQNRVCPEGATLRSLFLDFVKEETARGEIIDSRIEGRIIIK